MIARYLGPTVYSTDGTPDLCQGDEYDVAEILECPTYLMARSPSGGAWPLPGSVRFQLDYDSFSLRGRVPAESCGYSQSIILRDSFGVISTDPAEMDIFERTARLLEVEDLPDAGETLARWRERVAFSGTAELAAFVWGVEALGYNSPEIAVCRNAVYPTTFRNGVGVIAFWSGYIVHSRMDVLVASRIINWMLMSIALPKRQPTLLSDVLWVPDEPVRFYDDP